MGAWEVSLQRLTSCAQGQQYFCNQCLRHLLFSQLGLLKMMFSHEALYYLQLINTQF